MPIEPRKPSRRRAKPAPPPPVPRSHLDAIQAAGFEVLGWLNEARTAALESGETRSEGLPRIMVAPGSVPGTFKLVEWLPLGHPHNAYSFGGWQASDGRSCGGMYQDVLSALAWFPWLERAKLGQYH